MILRREELRTPPNINANVESLNVLEYARKYETVQRQADVGLPGMFVPRSSINDFFLECRHAGSYPDSSFVWPSNKVMYQKTLSIAATIMPPGYMMSIPNGAPIPDDYGDEPECFYHGTWASCVPLILRKGFLPSYGTGSYTAGAWYLGNVSPEGRRRPPIELIDESMVVRPAAGIPLVRTTKDFQEACKHPKVCETQDFPQGTVLATDGTHPMTAVFRVVAKPNSYLWRGFSKSPSYGFRPEDLHITHVYLLATPPEYADKIALRDAIIEYEMDPVDLHNDFETNIIELDAGGDAATRVLHDGNDHVRIFKDLRAKCAKVTVRCRPGYVMDCDDYDGDVPPLNDFSRKRTLENEFLSGPEKRQDLKQIARARLGHSAEHSFLHPTVQADRRQRQCHARGHEVCRPPLPGLCRWPPFGLQLPRALHHRDEPSPSEGNRRHTRHVRGRLDQ